MPKKSVMQFHDYSVSELHYKSCPTPDGQHDFEMRPNFSAGVQELGDNRYDVTLSVDIPSTEENPLPFELRASITGHFSFTEDMQDEGDADFRQKLLRQNTIAILFPFLRAMVSTLTATANVPPLMLPIINLMDHSHEA